MKKFKLLKRKREKARLRLISGKRDEGYLDLKRLQALIESSEGRAFLEKQEESARMLALKRLLNPHVKHNHRDGVYSKAA